MQQPDENCPEVVGTSPKDDDHIIGKMTDLEFKDPFEHAPKKPDGDHWELLLRPLLQEDKAQCESWKDEVSNLLIFAGLFSAVVTAFIIESYKGLQRDPNDDMILLLSQIVDRLGNPVNNTSGVPPSMQSPGTLPIFSPSRSSIRINIFWFISLVLSLTTVLVGIVSLQWLREHQNYINLSPIQQYAVFHMRKEGLKKWHVRGIFTSMPLLLQLALVLFFTGMIDFLLAFDDVAVVIPVAVVIGLTLLFLVATTLFPTLQGLYLYFIFSFSGGHENIPVQCPYKSPQSDAVRALSPPLFTVLHVLHPYLRSVSRKIWKWLSRAGSVVLPLRGISRTMTRVRIKTRKWLDKRIWTSNWNAGIDSTFLKHIAYADRTWLAFDLNWLAIRDGFMRRTYNRPLDHYDRLEQDTKLYSYLPIWDIIRGLISQTHPDISPAYHAFMEVSDVAHSGSDDSRNAYLYDVVSIGGLYEPDVSFSDFYEDISGYLDAQPLAKYQSLFTFLYMISSQNNIAVTLHMDELQLRLMQYLFTRNCPVREKMRPEGPLPVCLMAVPGLYHETSIPALLPQLVQVTTTLFKQLNREHIPNALVSVHCARQDGIRQAMQCFSLLLSSQSTSDEVLQAISTIFDAVNEDLVQEIHAVILPSSGTARATLLFYAAAIFVHGTAWIRYRKPLWARPPSSFKMLLCTIQKYKSLTVDIGLSDPNIEMQLAAPYDHPSTFSASWWSSLEIGASWDSSIHNHEPEKDGHPVPILSMEHVVLALAEARPHASETKCGPPDSNQE